ncbi:MAG: DUF1684 domain-containing protein [Gammaproteobacteria bacterium]|jgi:uncharacterized protein (DUF1684 family)|nr:DUF1684 domain-containing protein [Gammaproteobacteria bacterium]
MKKGLVIPLMFTLIAACGRAEPEADPAAYDQDVHEWRAGRLERLLAPTGYLNQIGLYWLEQGTYVLGSDPASDIVLPQTAAPRIAEIIVGDEGVRLIVEEGVEVLVDGQAVSDMPLLPDVSGKAVMVSHRSLAWMLIERGGKLAIRVRDYEHPFVDSFGPLPYYEIDPEMRVTAKLEPYTEPRTIAVDTVIEGFQQFPVAPGVASFELNGQQYDLEPTISGDKLFFVFGDATNRDETYGAGRFLYADAPGDDGLLILDFNLSYSPPCAFNDFSTCPIASPRNRLPIRIEAGEKFTKDLHYSGSAGH